MTADRPRRSFTIRARVRTGMVAMAGVLLATASVLASPAANAIGSGNYALNIQGRADFHTYIWAIGPTTDNSCQSPGCLYVSQRNQPIAKAYDFTEFARLADGHWTLVVDDPFGLRCGNIYYGPTIQTHDVYTWDPVTLAGSMESHFDTDCAGGPPGSYTYPFWLVRM